MRYFKSTMILVLTLLAVSCSSGLTHKTKSLPDWYLNTPDEEAALYGIGEFEGEDLGLTRQGAEAAARDEVARQMEIKINNMITTSKQMAGGKIDAAVVRSASNQIVSLSASQIKIIEREVITSRKGYIVYALAKMPIESLRDQAERTLEQEEIQRQLDVDADLQQILSSQVDKLTGLREE